MLIDRRETALTLVGKAKRRRRGRIVFHIVWSKKDRRFIAVFDDSKNLEFYLDDEPWRLVGSYKPNDDIDYHDIADMIEEDLGEWLEDNGVMS